MKWWLYLGSCVLVVLAPGPDNCFVLTQSAAFGASAGIAVTLGLVSGLCVHITLAVLGAAALLARFPRLADGVAVLGACYLLLVAWGMWGSAVEMTAAEARSWLGFYLKGVVLNLSNPKVILFFLAFLPRFLPTPCTHRSAHLCLLGGVFALCALVGMGAIALLGGALAASVRTAPESAIFFSRIAAVAVGAIAAWILIPLSRRLF